MTEQLDDAEPVSGDSNRPFPLGPERRFTMTVRTGLIVIGAVTVAAASWLSIKFDVAQQGRDLGGITSRLSSIEAEVSAARLNALEARMEQRAVREAVDYLVSDRRGPKPAAARPSPAP